jgi:hypothetical protein
MNQSSPIGAGVALNRFGQWVFPLAVIKTKSSLTSNAGEHVR